MNEQEIDISILVYETETVDQSFPISDFFEQENVDVVDLLSVLSIVSLSLNSCSLSLLSLALFSSTLVSFIVFLSL